MDNDSSEMGDLTYVPALVGVEVAAESYLWHTGQVVLRWAMALLRFDEVVETSEYIVKFYICRQTMTLLKQVIWPILWHRLKMSHHVSVIFKTQLPLLTALPLQMNNSIKVVRQESYGITDLQKSEKLWTQQSFTFEV